MNACVNAGVLSAAYARVVVPLRAVGCPRRCDKRAVGIIADEYADSLTQPSYKVAHEQRARSTREFPFSSS